MPSTRRLASAFLSLLALALLGCGSREDIDQGAPPEEREPDAGDGQQGEPPIPSLGGRAGLTVTGIVPASGPFAGGNEAIVRGSGFTDDAFVRIGGRLVQPADTIKIDGSSLRVIVPAGEPGVADITVEVGEDEATRRDAYTYNALYLEPNRGAVAGGTSVLVTVEGAELDEHAQLEIGGELCTELRVVTPHKLRCKTPRGAIGRVDAVLSFVEPGAELKPEDAPEELPDAIVAIDAFEYVDPADTGEGGLSGGAIEGSIDITVIEPETGAVIEGAFVMLGNDLDTPYQGLTDERGQITFSDEGLEGPVDLHVAAKCFERASILGFDARSATVHLLALLDPTCAMPGDLMPGTGRATAGSLISGELVFPGSEEFAVNGWDVIPKPRENEVRVAYVYTTHARIGAPNPNPALGGALSRVTEEGSALGEHGYEYNIFARPAGLAVYAIGGLERLDTGHFTPYVMGVTRDIVTAPGEENAEVNVHMNLPLDRVFEIELVDVPEPTPSGPTEVRVQAHLDLGGEGVIMRAVNGRRFDVRASVSAAAPFRFLAQPALTGTLSDARYAVIAGYYTGDSSDTPPLTEVRLDGIDQGGLPLVIDDMLQLPRAIAPLDGGRLPEDRVLRWELPGTQPDLFMVSIIGGDGFPAWFQLVPGSQSHSVVPDLSELEALGDIAPGVLSWTVQAARMPGFVFDELKYALLASRFYSHTSIDSFTMRR